MDEANRPGPTVPPSTPTPSISNPMPGRRETDYVTGAQLELLFERFGRTMDSAVSSITNKMELMQVNIERKLESIEQNMNFQDRTLSSRIDATVVRQDNQDKRIEELSTRGSRNFRLALTGLVFPIIVAVALFVVEKLAN